MHERERVGRGAAFEKSVAEEEKARREASKNKSAKNKMTFEEPLEEGDLPPRNYGDESLDSDAETMKETEKSQRADVAEQVPLVVCLCEHGPLGCWADLESWACVFHVTTSKGNRGISRRACMLCVCIHMLA